ncbi:MAG: HD-GYP domain-containing protein, partial [Planctomycetota bacterium]
MIRLPVAQVRNGDVLAWDVINPNDPTTVVLAAGSTLNERVLSALRSSGFRSLWIQDGSSFDYGQWVSPVRAQAIRQLAGNLKQSFEETASSLAAGEGLSLHISPQEIQSLIEELDGETLVYAMPDEVADSRGVFLFHSVNVCCLSLLIGLACRRAQPDHEELTNLSPLGMGALFHDIGKLKLPDAVRFRDPWELSRADFEVIQTHTTLGFELLRESLGAVVANIPLCHHRNEDGTGYPSALAESGVHLPDGDRVHFFSHIVAVADAYDHLITYSGYNSLEAMEEVLCARRHHFDPFVLEAFERVVPALHPGARIKLNTGHGGVVTDFEPDVPFCPTILLTVAANGDPLRTGQHKAIQLAKATTSVVTHYEDRSVKKERGHPLLFDTFLSCSTFQVERLQLRGHLLGRRCRMTTARHEVVVESIESVYHCVNRCVRRAFL